MNELLIIGSFILDLVFGDPELIFPHPIAIIGKFISKTEKIFYRDDKIYGLIFSIFVIGCVYFITAIIEKVLALFHGNLSYLLLSIFGSFTISLRSLHLETKKVVDDLILNDINSARKKLSFLVSRDTFELEKSDIIRSLIETISENLTDGVIAPIFYYFIGGIKLAFLYKTVNTLDSMIGYKNSKYKNFGFFSAKLDDILNFIPSRIAGILVVISAFLLRFNYKNSFKIMLRDHNKTDSPNSGYTESAFAGALNIQLGGPTPYFGVWYDKPFIGDEIEKLSIIHVKKSYKLLYLSSILFLLTLHFYTVIVK